MSQPTSNGLTIKGSWVKQPKSITDQRGRLTQWLDGSDGDRYHSFYEVTFEEPYIVRANHWHLKKTELLRCIQGSVILHLLDIREHSETKNQHNVITLSAWPLTIVRVPQGVVHALVQFEIQTGTSGHPLPAIVQVFATKHHDPRDDHPQLLVPTLGNKLDLDAYRARFPTVAE